MKTFKLYCEEDSPKWDIELFTNNPKFKKLIEILTGPIFRYKIRPETVTLNGVSLNRNFIYATPNDSSYFGIDIDKDEMIIDVPKINVGNEGPLHPSSYDTTRILFAAKIRMLDPNITKSPTLKIPWTTTSNFFDFDKSAGDTWYDIWGSLDVFGELMTQWAERFEIYNLYCDTPGSEVDKALAVANYVSLSRLDILNLKRRFGILKHEEIGDEDMIGML